MSDRTKLAPALPLALTRRIDQICDEYEQAFAAGEPPSLEDFLTRIDPVAASDLLSELVAVELDHWTACGAADPKAKILQRTPRLRDRIEQAAHWVALTRYEPSLSTAETCDSTGLHVRCPHCRQPIELVVDARLTDIVCSSCGSSFSLLADDNDSTTAPPISQVGHFELIERLGLGNFGSVWRARDLNLDRTVAVKIPRKGQLEPRELEQFFREARAAAQLNHPNIVSVHEVGREDNNVFIVSDLVHGQTLSQWTARQQPSCAEAAKLCAKIAAAIHYAHEQGVIHRDLKPSNIMIDESGQPHIMDFGLAKREAGEITMTVDGQLIGTPAYMSPEQAMFEAHHADARSDVYSLGVILYQLTTGELPFDGNVRTIIQKVIHDEAPHPRSLNRNLDGDLATICLKCLEKEPTARYQTAAALRDDLARYLRGEPLAARRPGLWRRGWRSTRRLSRRFGFRRGAVALVVAAVVAAGSTVWIRHANRRALEAGEIAARRAADLASLEYANQITEAYSAWEEGWSDQARKLLYLARPVEREAAENASGPAGLEWRLLDGLTQPPQPRVLAGHQGAVNEVAVFPDGRRVASVGEDGTLRIWDAVTGQNLNTIDFGKELPDIDLSTGGLHSVAVSPDGRYVVAGADVVGICDLQQEGDIRELFRADYNVESLAFSSDGGLLAAGVRYQELLLVTLHGTVQKRLPSFGRGRTVTYIPGRRKWLAPRMPVAKSRSSLLMLDEDFSSMTPAVDTTQLPFDAQFDIGRNSPDGRYLAAGTQIASLVQLFDVDTGLPVAAAPEYRAHLSDLCIAPDGKRLAVGYQNGVVRCLQLQTKGNRSIAFAPGTETFRAHRVRTNAVRFLDAETLVTCGDDGLVKLWTPFRTPRRTPIRPNVALLDAVAFSPDGRHLLATYNSASQVSLHDCTSGARTSSRRFQRPKRAIWSHTGLQVALLLEDSREVRLLDSQLQDQYILQCPHVVHGIDFSADGSLLATIGQDELVLFSTENGQVTGRLDLDNTGTTLQFSDAGKWLAFGGNGDLLGIWNWTDSEESIKLPSVSGTRHMAISPDDTLLASGHTDGIVRLWELQSAKLLGELAGHRGELRGLQFSRDGRTLISVATDRQSRIWSVPQQRCLGVLDDEILAISPNERQLVIGYHQPDTALPATFIQSIDQRALGFH